MQRSPTRRGEERAHPYGTRLLPGEVGIWLKHSGVPGLGPNAYSFLLSVDRVGVPFEEFAARAAIRIAREPDVTSLKAQIFLAVIELVLQFPAGAKLVVWGYRHVAGVE